MLFICRNIILEREFLINLKINPNICEQIGSQASPFLVTKCVKNRSTLVLYKVMIKKGISTLKNEANNDVAESS